MGCGGSKVDSEANRAIEAQMKHDKLLDDHVNKLLLLGSGESGKSTIFKQVSSLYVKAPTKADLQRLEVVVYGNMYDALLTLSRKAVEYIEAGRLEGSVDEELQLSMDFIDEAASQSRTVDEEVIRHFEKVWNHPIIIGVLALRNEFQYNESVGFFFGKLETIASPDYCPDFEDMLRVRLRTTGTSEIKLKMDGSEIRIVDVGGQKSERTKWIHQFEGVRAILFVNAVSEYDQMMFEDDTTNRMHDSLSLFRKIVGLQWFKTTQLIVFLNKKDLFEAKFPASPLSIAFEEWDDKETDLEEAYDFIKAKFQEQVEDKEKLIVFHITCAMNTDNIETVFTAVKTMVIQEHLDGIGIA